MNYDVGVTTSRLLLPPEPVFGVPGVAAVVAPAWYDLYSQTLNVGNESGYTTYTVRQVAAVAAYSGAAPATGTQLRVTIQGGTSLGLIWSKVYVGHAAGSGDVYDFDGTQVQLLWSGSAGGSVASGSVTLVSDAVSYSFDKTKPLVISIYITGPDDMLGRKTSATNFTRAFKSGDVAATSDITADVSDPSILIGFPKVEVYG